jgi:hypothetical protein
VSTTIDSNKACAEIACSSPSGRGGGVFLQFINSASYSLAINDSTISGNTAGQRGGGCYCNVKTTTLNNSTIAFNVAVTGGGVYIQAPAMINLQSTIIANNAATSDVDLHVGGSLDGTSAGNLIPLANQSPAGTLTSDPQLGPLADHGGPTRTHALNPGSPAVNAGNNSAVLATDQRGDIRVVGAGPDIGAYERQTNDDEIFYGGFQ